MQVSNDICIWRIALSIDTYFSDFLQSPNCFGDLDMFNNSMSFSTTRQRIEHEQQSQRTDPWLVGEKDTNNEVLKHISEPGWLLLGVQLELLMCASLANEQIHFLSNPCVF